MSARDLTDEERNEIARHGIAGVCPSCQMWQTYIEVGEGDVGFTVRCHGCRRSVGECPCRFDLPALPEMGE